MVANVIQNPVSEAEQDALDAEQAVADLEQKVVEGDTSITASAIEKARGVARFARLKVQAVMRQAAKDAEAARDAEVQQFLAEYEEFATSDLAPVREAYEDVVLALAHLGELVSERVEGQAQVLRRAQALGLMNIGPRGTLDEQARWRSIAVPGDTATHALDRVIDDAVREAKHGYVKDGTQKVRAHALHSDIRRADMKIIDDTPSGERAQVAAELLARFRAE
ncbi:hypothetical protein GS921_15525 [Rhodococcus hoagii]|nr:hypothetical protein [Prescottella equi]